VVCSDTSQQTFFYLRKQVARKMKDEEGFYYPHNLDFRGRAYPMHPYLNHLGSDLCRGMLEFAEGRPLGMSGLCWLKIHLANLYAGGVDKLSYNGRITFIENHLEDIFDSADRPLEGKRWWLRAEDPFQCLAACINLAEALRSTSPETTISHLPVHQVTEKSFIYINVLPNCSKTISLFVECGIKVCIDIDLPLVLSYLSNLEKILYYCAEVLFWKSVIAPWNI